MPLRVVIADDHPVYRDGLAHLLNDLDGIEVVGVAANGQQAIDLAKEFVPDVIIMDLRMPELDGIEATRRITAAYPSIGVVVLTMFDGDEMVLAAVRAGARRLPLEGRRRGRDRHRAARHRTRRGDLRARHRRGHARPPRTSGHSA